MNRKELEQISCAQTSFEKTYGKSEKISASFSKHNGKPAIVVQDEKRKAIYNLKSELVEVLNFSMEKES